MVLITRSWRRNGCVRVDGGLAPQGGHHTRGRRSKTAPNCANRQTRYQHTAILLCIWLMPTERGATAETTDFKCQTKGKMRKKRTEGKKTETKQSDGRSIIVSIRRELLVLSVRQKYTVLVVQWGCFCELCLETVFSLRPSVGRGVSRHYSGILLYSSPTNQ